MITAKWVNQFKSFLLLSDFHSPISFMNFAPNFMHIWDAWMHWTCFSFYVYALFNIYKQPPQTTKTTLLSPKCMLFPEHVEKREVVSSKWKLLISFNESLYEIFSSSIFKRLTDSFMWKYGRKILYFFVDYYVMRYIQSVKRVRTYNNTYTYNNIRQKKVNVIEILKPHVALTFCTDMMIMMWLHYDIEELILIFHVDDENFIRKWYLNNFFLGILI